MRRSGATHITVNQQISSNNDDFVKRRSPSNILTIPKVRIPLYSQAQNGFRGSSNIGTKNITEETENIK